MNALASIKLFLYVRNVSCLNRPDSITTRPTHVPFYYHRYQLIEVQPYVCLSFRLFSEYILYVGQETNERSLY